MLVFLVVYGFFVTLNLGYMSVQWDEMPHLLGGLLLTRGQTNLYMTTYGYYPPLFDLITTGFLQVLGATAIAGRLVSVIFSLLALWTAFELGNRMYGPKIGLVASVLLGVMPGFLWLSRITMLETILIFFFTLTMLVFYEWITKNSNKALIFSGLILGVGILAKYQILVAAIAMAVSILLLARKRLKISLIKLLIILVIAFLVIAPWFLMVYQFNGMTKFQTVGYVVQVGGENRPSYSNRFFYPVFYFIEMTWPYAAVHPVSLPIMILGFSGLVFFAYRRKREDIFLFPWFAVVFAFFSVIPDKQWRYVDVLFPLLGISAAALLIFLYGRLRSWKPKRLGIAGERQKKLAALVFIVIAVSTIAYSTYDAYNMTARDEIHIPIQEATTYLAGHLDQNQSAVIICAFNLLDQDMFRFYMPSNMSQDQIWQYPYLPVDAYTPNFNITELVNLCYQRNVKYIILFDFGPHQPFFNTTLDYTQVETMIYNTHMFGDPKDQPFFGSFYGNYGYRLFLVRFVGNQTQT